MAKIGKLDAAEAIRGISCLFVIFSHLSLTFFPTLHNFFDAVTPTQDYELMIHDSPFGFWYSGTVAVFIFFTLSGYVLAYSVVNSKNPIQKLQESAIKRLPRLMIPSLVSCIILWVVYNLIHPDMSGVSYWGASIGKVPSLQLWYALFDGSIKTFFLGYSDYNWVLWTMRVELIGSFILYAFFFLREKFPKIIWLFPFIIAVCCSEWLWLDYVPDFIQKPFSQIGLLNFAPFFIGALLYLFKREMPKMLGIGVLLLGLYFAGAHNDSDAYQWISDNILEDNTYDILNFLGGMLIVIAFMWSERVGAFFVNPVTLFLGKISFAAYLLHLSILYAVGIPFFNMVNQQTGNYFLAGLSAVVVVVMLTIMLSELFYRAIDKTSSHYINRFSNWVLRK